MANQSPLLLCLGYGYVASALASVMAQAGWCVVGTSRRVTSSCHARIILPQEVAEWLPQARAILISIPPGEGHDWSLSLFETPLSQLCWLGYLSSTGIYGDHDGAWVDETTPPAPHDKRTSARLQAEREWQALNQAVQCFRLAGIYGPGRNALCQLQQGTARRLIKPGQVFSRIHVADIASILAASIAKPEPGMIYNIADDLPAPSHEVMEYAASLLSLSPPPAELYDQANASPMARSFYAANRRVSNRRIKKALGIELAYPTYIEGLNALLRERTYAN